MASRFYVTTPIYYINDVPHLGTAYTTIAADVLCRYHRLRGHESRMLTGTDEHGLKIQRAAEARGVAPGAHADEIAAVFRATWPKLGCAPDDFIRTSEPRHKKAVQELWSRIKARGDIYLGHYEGLYCVGCEAYYTEKDLEQPGNVCPLHKKPAESVKEESYFFRLSRYGDALLDYYKRNPTFVQPASRLNEVVSFVREGLQDLSVSRTTFEWGIPVPDDPKHVMYVWFDALANYMTALREPEDNTRFWPADVHLVGKDILRFHAVYWPAFLLSAGYGEAELPRQVFAHGFLTYSGQKMSKTLRNTISPVEVATALSEAAAAALPGGPGAAAGAPLVGVDVVRYCLMRAISFGQDGDFSLQDVLSRYGSELGNALGNLLNRVLPFAEEVPAKGALGPLEEELAGAQRQAAAAAATAFDANQPTRALDAIWTVIAAANLYIDKAAPWVAKKTDPARLGTIIATLIEQLEAISVMISPVMPVVAGRMREQLGLPPIAFEEGSDRWPMALPSRAPGEKLHRGSPIFPRLEKEKEAELLARFAPPRPDAEPGKADAKAGAKVDAQAGAKADSKAAPAASGGAEVAAPPARQGKSPVAFDDFARLDLRIGVVTSAERVKKKDRLLDLRVDTGDGAPRRIISGIAASYAPEELVGKRIVVICNLPPRDFGKGLVSEGMLLTAEVEGRVRTITVEDAAPGTPVF
ncbi:metG1 [Sorangium cellulosum So ce56]|uniref:Methionine--tRNA ligase n=1 Tax=Sorangium cellulosum (strain So ce56) TaxID=448385 RepID=A9GLJ7_SORC5|nr:methionine--tRNA ligase [Sorangium cellulosum]CAN90284.1 metG1 [Sorangium cellulosum So ce56]